MPQGPATLRTGSPAIALLLVALSSTGTAGCVYESVYRDALAESQRLRQSLAQEEIARKQAEDRAQMTQTEAGRLQKSLHQREAELSDLQVLSSNLQAKLGDSTTIDAALRQDLERLAKQTERLARENQSLSKSLEETRAQLEQARGTQSAQNGLSELFEQWKVLLKKRIDARELSLVLQDDRIVCTLPNDVLFRPGKADLTPRAKAILKELAGALKPLQAHSIQVAGHTDDIPSRSPRFPSNWSLSAGRAVEIVSFLVAQGVRPERLFAAGYGEFAPAVPHGSPESKTKNRRIEITVSPVNQSPRDLSQSTMMPKASLR